MNWNNLFTPVANLDNSRARQYIDSHMTGSFQLLDVRQPKEYEKEHLPDAVSIPLPELPDRLTELAEDKPTIVYCAIGGRSRAAAQLLSANGFSEVYNLTGGIKAWHGIKASGPEEISPDLFQGDEEFSDAVALAMAMEDNLQQLYMALAQETGDQEQKKLFEKLAGFEEKHKQRLRQELDMADGTSGPGRADIIEGGYSPDRILEYARTRLQSCTDIFDLAMMMETQALDFYGRLTRKSSDPAVAGVFRRLADEEKMHLGYLAVALDKLL